MSTSGTSRQRLVLLFALSLLVFAAVGIAVAMAASVRRRKLIPLRAVAFLLRYPAGFLSVCLKASALTHCASTRAALAYPWLGSLAAC